MIGLLELVAFALSLWDLRTTHGMIRGPWYEMLLGTNSIAREQILPKVYVSTIFLPAVMRYGERNYVGLWYETMAFDYRKSEAVGNESTELGQWRCATRAEALAEHACVCVWVRGEVCDA